MDPHRFCTSRSGTLWHRRWVPREGPPRGIVDGTFDDICFRPAVPGDFDSNGVLEIRDIDMLSREIGREGPRPQFDLNDDDWVDRCDHEIWVHELKNTWFGDAEPRSANSTAATWSRSLPRASTKRARVPAGPKATGTASGVFDSSDMVAAFVDGGYEKGPRTDAAAVPEPASWHAVGDRVITLVVSVVAIGVPCKEPWRHSSCRGIVSPEEQAH